MDRDIRKNRLLKFNIMALNQIGLVYFDDQRFPKFEYWKGVFCVFSFVIFNITEYMFVFINIHDVSLISLNLATSLLYSSLIVKGATFIWHNKKYFKLMTDMHNAMKFVENSKHDQLKRILDKHVFHCYEVAVAIFVFTTISLIIFSAYLFYTFLVESV